ncbi:hypothetical protein, partial [Lactiplantibacillus pentosus]|uniref:hypothetical protein n=1 Tax=Lactiplantibacillus pentosus TaxID=1589 RepID=UPI0021A5A63A
LREFKSMSALFQRCQPAPEVGLGRASADEQESTNWHVLIMIHDRLTNTTRNEYLDLSDRRFCSSARLAINLASQ